MFLRISTAVLLLGVCCCAYRMGYPSRNAASQRTVRVLAVDNATYIPGAAGGLRDAVEQALIQRGFAIFRQGTAGWDVQVQLLSREDRPGAPGASGALRDPAYLENTVVVEWALSRTGGPVLLRERVDGRGLVPAAGDTLEAQARIEGSTERLWQEVAGQIAFRVDTQITQAAP